MELAQLLEAGSSQAEQRASVEQAVEKAKAKMDKLAELVRQIKERFTEADGESAGGVHNLKRTTGWRITNTGWLVP